MPWRKRGTCRYCFLPRRGRVPCRSRRYCAAQVSGADIDENEAPLEIRITTDAEARTITFEDSGVGFTKEQLREHLGTIAHSGSKEFLKEMSAQGSSGDLASNIIGQFGVGFYSAFMVGDTVDVFSRSALSGHDANKWSSHG